MGRDDRSGGNQRRWTIKPDAGVAIATGRTAGILVVDIDTTEGHGDDGYASLAELEACNGIIPDTLSVTTPSGGRHLYCNYPEELSTRQTFLN